MSHINNLLNYYIENDYLNLNNNITLDDLNLLIDSINKFNIIIKNINIPINFKYIDLIKEKYVNINIKEY
jgi:hypothetical protein